MVCMDGVGWLLMDITCGHPAGTSLVESLPFFEMGCTDG